MKKETILFLYLGKSFFQFLLNSSITSNYLSGKGRTNRLVHKLINYLEKKHFLISVPWSFTLSLRETLQLRPLRNNTSRILFIFPSIFTSKSQPEYVYRGTSFHWSYPLCIFWRMHLPNASIVLSCGRKQPAATLAFTVPTILGASARQRLVKRIRKKLHDV